MLRKRSGRGSESLCLDGIATLELLQASTEDLCSDTHLIEAMAAISDAIPISKLSQDEVQKRIAIMAQEDEHVALCSDRISNAYAQLSIKTMN